MKEDKCQQRMVVNAIMMTLPVWSGARQETNHDLSSLKHPANLKGCLSQCCWNLALMQEKKRRASPCHLRRQNYLLHKKNCLQDKGITEGTTSTFGLWSLLFQGFYCVVKTLASEVEGFPTSSR